MNMRTNPGEMRRKNAGDRLDDAVEMNAVVAALKTRDAEIKQFTEKAAAEIKANGAMAAETKSALEKLSESASETQDRLQALEQKMSRRAFGGGDDQKSFGAQLTDLPEFKTLQQTKSGTVRLEVKTGATLTSATTDAAGSVGAGIQPHRVPGIVIPGQREFRIRDLLLNGPTSSDTIEWVVEKAFTNAAAPVAENPGSAKPKSTAQHIKKTAPVQTIAHWFAASRQVLGDVPQLMSYINDKLLYGLAYEVEEQILTGDGDGQNLLGILPQAAKFKQSLYSEEADTLHDSLRRASLQVRVAEYNPTFVVLNPVDFCKAELIKDKEDRYIEVSIRNGGEKRFWNLAVVESMSMPQGQFLVGAGMAAQVWDREQAAVQVSTQHDDFFTKNLVAVLGETRLALAVYRPDAFVHGQFDLEAGFDSPPDGINE